jgi:hypothetical protein
VKFGDEFILFRADPLLPPFKIGYFSTHGWMAYWLDGVLFRKTFHIQTSLPYPDNNCNAEMYCNNRFVELESLGPLTKLLPGALLEHVEIWELDPEINSLPEEIQNFMV